MGQQSDRIHTASQEPSTFVRICGTLETLLDGPLRASVIDAAARHPTMGRALAYLTERMRAHAWRARDIDVSLGDTVARLDQATRREGFHVLHDWNGKADAVTANTIAIDAVEFASSLIGDRPVSRDALALALDYYFLYVLALVAMRSWDEGEPGENLDRVTDLLGRLQGPSGSGQRFADNAETLLLIATSHFEPNESGYDLLLARARGLPQSNRTSMALTHAQAMGGHLRFGYEVTYGKDFKAMRDDNGADYPWLLFGLSGLMDEYDRLAACGEEGLRRDRIVEGLINGLTPDPTAVVAKPVSWFASHTAELERFLALLRRHRSELIPALESHRPREAGYWPIALFFNFSQNVLKGVVVDSLLRGAVIAVGLNDLFTGMPRNGAAADARVSLARRLTAYARANPDTIRGRQSPVIVYDPIIGRQAFGGAIRAIKQMP
jgi:hypothetical protein